MILYCWIGCSGIGRGFRVRRGRSWWNCGLRGGMWRALGAGGCGERSMLEGMICRLVALGLMTRALFLLVV
jgi:hypothetical protein